MSNFTLVVSATVAALNTDYSFENKGAAVKARGVLKADLVAQGYVVDECDAFVLWKGSELVSLDIDEDDEDEGPFLSEYEQGWANIRADERAAVQRQNREDAEYERQRRSVPSYNGVRGSLEPDGGYIFEP